VLSENQPQTGIFLAIAYYLLFYDLTFEYHYTTLIPISSRLLVTRPEFPTIITHFHHIH